MKAARPDVFCASTVFLIVFVIIAGFAAGLKGGAIGRDDTPFEIVTIYDEDFYAPNGDVLGTVTHIRPVFRSSFRYADKFNGAFGQLTSPLSTREIRELYSDWLEASDEWIDSGYGYGYAGFFDEDICRAPTYNDGRVVSFYGYYSSSYPGAIHPFGDSYGVTFDLQTGDILKITDMLSIGSNEVEETIFNEYISYLRRMGHEYLADMVIEGPGGIFSNHYEDSVREQCGENAMFWLAADGIHIYFHQYTFDYATGPSELVIPYSRTDLVRPEFAVSPQNWAEAYKWVLQDKEADIKNFEEHYALIGTVPMVAVIDICGDETPELLFVTRERNDIYSMYVWGYDGGAVCLLDALFMGAEAGAGATFGVAKLSGGRLLTFHQNGDESWGRSYRVFQKYDEYKSLIQAAGLYHDSSPQYQYENYWDMPYIHTYYRDSTVIDRSSYEFEVTNLLSDIQTPLMALFYGDWEYSPDHFRNTIAMTYDEAIAYLNSVPVGSDEYDYQPLTPGGGFVVRPGDLERISDAQSARSAIHDAIASLTPEQRRSGDALDTVTLFIENAVRSGASRNVYGEVSLSAPVLEDLADMAREILYSAGDSLVGEDVSLLRRLRNNVNIKTDETDSLVIAFPDDVSGIGFDSVTVEAEFASVTLNRESILRGGGVEVRRNGESRIENGELRDSDGGRNGNTPGDSGSRGQGDRGVGFWRNIRPLDVWFIAFIVLMLILRGILAARGHRFRAWVIPVFCVLAVAVNAYTIVISVEARSAAANVNRTIYDVRGDRGNGGSGSNGGDSSSVDSIDVRLSEGVRATVSLPAYGREKDFLVLLSEDGIPQYSKYNPVTDMVDTRIRESGVYTLREYTMSFIDVEQKSELMKEAISQLASRNIMTGTTDGFFFPDMPITRAQLVSAIVRAFDLLDPDAVSGFEDLSRSDWYYAAVATAERENLISGFEDNTFRGEIDIPKDQLVAITANTLIERMGYIVPYEIEELLAIYLDRDTLAPWSEDRIALATQSNIMIYRTDSLFAPRSIMTRGDAAIVLYRVFNKVW